jgi:hypothetical protein
MNVFFSQNKAKFAVNVRPVSVPGACLSYARVIRGLFNIGRTSGESSKFPTFLAYQYLPEFQELSNTTYVSSPFANAHLGDEVRNVNFVVFNRVEELLRNNLNLH